MNSHHLIYYIVALLLLASCAGGGKGTFDLRGVWELQSIHMADASEFDYDSPGRYVPVRIFMDSTYYVGQKSAMPGRLLFSTTYSGRYRLIDRGTGEWLYLEDGNPHDITIIDDSTINIMDIGRTCRWRRMPQGENVSDIMDVVELHHDSWDDDVNTYVFTEREHTLQSRNNHLISIALSIIFAFILLALYTRSVLRRKRHVEMQLRQIREEREARPELVQQAMQSVEDEFLHSDYYLSLRRSITQGQRLRDDHWQEIEQRINHTYPGFSNRLFNLHHMSQLELQTCLLIKLRVPTTEIACVLMKDVSTISSLRSRLYRKVFHEKGGAKEWNDFILTL